MGYIETAVGMYNAGELLYGYFKNTQERGDDKERGISVFIPMVIVYIFGIEMGIKALIQKQGG